MVNQVYSKTANLFHMKTVEFNEEDGIPEDLPDGTVIVFKGKNCRIINGKFVPDEEEDTNDNKIPKNEIVF